MNINQYAVYQLKESAELAAYRSRSYQYLTEHHFQVIVQNYQQAYFTKLFTSDTLEMIRKRLEEHRPKKLHKKKNTRLGERIDIIFSTRRVFHSAGMCLLEAEGFHPCRQVGFAGI